MDLPTKWVGGKSHISDLFSAATTMTEGPRAIKRRIQILAKHPRRTVPMVLGMTVLSAVLMACTFTSGVEVQEKEIDLSVFVAESDMGLELTGQWGNYYQFRLGNIDFNMEKHRLEIMVCFDGAAETLIGDGTPQE